MSSILKFTENSFSTLVEEMVIKRGMSYIESVLFICERENLEPDSVGSLLSTPIKEKLKIEGQEINIIKKSTPPLSFL
jgi:hypothetical protein